MSYTIIRSFKATPEKLYFNCGDNNIVPHIWSDCSEETNDNNIKDLCLGLIHGDYHPYSSIRLAQFSNMLSNLLAQLKTVTSWEKDWYYGINPGRNYHFDEYFAKTIGVALFKDFYFGENTATTYLCNEAKQYLKTFEEESARIYEEAERKQKEGNIIHTRSAIISDIFAGHDILVDNNNNYIIAKRENYDNHGHLDNSDGSAIILDNIEEDDNISLFYFLSDGSGFKHVSDDVYKKIEDKLLESDNANLYNCFHILTLAKQKAMLSY